MTRIFVNSPMLPDRDAVERYAHSLGALAIRGYVGPDGSHRALLEITPDAAAELVDEESERIERQAAELHDQAERMKP